MNRCSTRLLGRRKSKPHNGEEGCYQHKTKVQKAASRGCGKLELWEPLVGMSNGAAAVEVLKILKETYHEIWQFPFWLFTQEH